MDQTKPRSSRRRRGEGFWRRTLIAQRHSGLSQLEFCRRNDLALSTFHRWRNRLGDAIDDSPESEPEFIPVEIRPERAPVPSGDDGFELVFPSGLRLSLPSRVEGRDLVEVLWALEVAGAC